MKNSLRRKIPVVLGGGISSRELVQSGICPKADAVQVASKSVVTKECDAAEAYKKPI